MRGEIAEADLMTNVKQRAWRRFPPDSASVPLFRGRRRNP